MGKLNMFTGNCLIAKYYLTRIDPEFLDLKELAKIK